MLTLPPLCQATTQDPAEAGRLLFTDRPCRADATHRVVGYSLGAADLAATHHELACAAHADQLAEQWTDKGVLTTGKRRQKVLARVHPYRPGSLYPTTLQPMLEGLPFYVPQHRPAAPAAVKPAAKRTPPPRQAPLWSAAVQVTAAAATPAAAVFAEPPALVLPPWLRAKSQNVANDRWAVECSRHTGDWLHIRMVDGERIDAEDWAHYHALDHVQEHQLVTAAELELAEAAALSRGQAEVLGWAERGELTEDLRGFYVADGGNWQPKTFGVRRVRTLLARGYLAWPQETTNYRRYVPLSAAGRAMWSAWTRARRLGLVDYADTDTDTGVTDRARRQFVLLAEEFPEARAALGRDVDAEQPARPPTVDTAVDWHHPADAGHVLVRERLVEYDGHRYTVRRAREGEPMTLTRADGGPVLADGLRWWSEVEQAVTEHAQAGGRGGVDELGPCPVIPWGLSRLTCPVTLHPVGPRWLRVACCDCDRLDIEDRLAGLGEHDHQAGAVHAAVHHAQAHEKRLRGYMEAHRREAAAKDLAPHFAVELWAVLAAAHVRADGLTWDGRRYRMIPADTPTGTASKGRLVRRELVELLQRGAYLYARKDAGPIRPTPDGVLAVEALTGVELPPTWPKGRKAPEDLPLLPGGWAHERRMNRILADLDEWAGELEQRLRTAPENAGDSPAPQTLV
ncbi:hypothetical protein [Kitasatospora sp. NPDC059160]|uniref:hypothetical protein n=1 Tax=Kitasatospora sp. NPDC059160 TaxID=3346748 RepID=UPI0036C3F16E